jgi:hypothetical protein
MLGSDVSEAEFPGKAFLMDTMSQGFLAIAQNNFLSSTRRVCAN